MAYWDSQYCAKVRILWNCASRDASLLRIRVYKMIGLRSSLFATLWYRGHSHLRGDNVDSCHCYFNKILALNVLWKNRYLEGENGKRKVRCPLQKPECTQCTIVNEKRRDIVLLLERVSGIFWCKKISFVRDDFGHSTSSVFSIVCRYKF